MRSFKSFISIFAGVILLAFTANIASATEYIEKNPPGYSSWAIDKHDFVVPKNDAVMAVKSPPVDDYHRLHNLANKIRPEGVCDLKYIKIGHHDTGDPEDEAQQV